MGKLTVNDLKGRNYIMRIEESSLKRLGGIISMTASIFFLIAVAQGVRAQGTPPGLLFSKLFSDGNVLRENPKERCWLKVTTGTKKVKKYSNEDVYMTLPATTVELIVAGVSRLSFADTFLQPALPDLLKKTDWVARIEKEARDLKCD